MAVPLKYLSNFWRAIEMHLINCKINLIVTIPTSQLNSLAIINRLSHAD